MGSHAVWYKFTNFLKEPIASIFRVEALKEVVPPPKLVVFPLEYRASNHNKQYSSQSLSQNKRSSVMYYICNLSIPIG
jgi:hypothetical protein